jgi:hypothetical protein
MTVLTILQRRWGYFFVLAITVSLPWQLAALRQAALGWFVAAISMLPLIWGWAPMLHSGPGEQRQKEAARAVTEEFRNLAEMIRGPDRRPFLAPWWHSPAIAYWSGQPGVAGSSHQSLPGIVDSARFLLAPTPDDAVPLIRARGVHWIFIHDLPRPNTDPPRYPAVDNAAQILLGDPEKAPPNTMGWMLAAKATYAPPWLRVVTEDERGHVYRLGKKAGETVVDTTMLFNSKQFLQLYEVLPNELPKTP